MAGADIQPNVDPIRISIVHYDSFDWKLKDGADINRALVYFKRTPPQFTSNTILFDRAEVATSVDNLAMNFEFWKSAESKSE